MKRDAWFPFNVGDYVRDTMHLTTEQHGAYLLLMLAYWPRGPLPDDDAALASIAKVPLPNWRKMRPTIQAFFQVAEGCWNQKRIDKERMRAFAITEVRKQSGAEGAAKRYGKPVANATRMPSQTDGHSTNNKYKNSSSTQSVSEAACVENARPRHPEDSPEPLSALVSKVQAGLLRKVAQ
jgi:uncharacterized protein YdaU (DUF1376 family)